MQVAVRGSFVAMDLPIDLIPAVLRDSGRTRGVQFWPRVELGEDYPHPAHVL